MITPAQLKKYFDADDAWGGDKRIKTVNMRDLDRTIFGVKGQAFIVKDKREAWCNDKYRFEIINVYENGQQIIFDADEERWLEVSKGAEFKFYKVTRKQINDESDY